MASWRPISANTPPPEGRTGLACCSVSGHSRPSVDVQTSLQAVEWRELLAEALRFSGFWTRTGALSTVIVITAAAAATLGIPLTPVLAAGATALATLGAFTLSYTVIGPRLRWPRIPPELLSVHWRVMADRIEAHRAGVRYELDWNDVDQVVLTPSLVVLRLGERGEVLGLPRRTATPLGESLIITWAEDSGAEVVRRRSWLRGERPVGARP
jgi:hypothetical protein